MKVCRNNFDIILYPVPKCSQCALRTHTRPCFWFKIVSTQATLECGGTIKDTISDIFKL